MKHFRDSFNKKKINQPKHTQLTMSTPHVKFNNGHEIPILALGTWRSAPQDVKGAVIEAVLHHGYRFLFIF